MWDAVEADPSFLSSSYIYPRIFYNPGRQLDAVVVMLLNGKIQDRIRGSIMLVFLVDGFWASLSSDTHLIFLVARS